MDLDRNFANISLDNNEAKLLIERIEYLEYLAARLLEAVTKNKKSKIDLPYKAAGLFGGQGRPPLPPLSQTK